MAIRLITFVVLALLIPVLSINAATMVEVDSQEGNSRMYTEGHKGRMEMPGNEGFVVIDTKKETMFVVMPARQMAFDMSAALDNNDINTSDQSNKTEFKRVGKGPKIAGYKTTQFDYSADGNHCGSVFVSKDALDDLGMEHMFAVFQKMAARTKGFAQNIMANAAPCEMADTLMSGKITEIGMPLRTLDADGTLKSLVTNIEKNAKLPPNPFSVPENYKIMKAGQMMQAAQERIQENKPQINDFLEKMKESGGLPPEAMERLKRAREMMEQYQQSSK